MQSALRSKDEVRLRTLRALFSALEYKRMQLNADLSNEDEIAVVKSEVKKRQEASEIYRKANATAKAEAEEAEHKILLEFLPAQVSEEDIKAAIMAVKQELGEGTDRGQLIGRVIAKFTKGTVDGGLVARLVAQQ